jgi:hypothetical protein
VGYSHPAVFCGALLFKDETMVEQPEIAGEKKQCYRPEITNLCVGLCTAQVQLLRVKSRAGDSSEKRRLMKFMLKPSGLQRAPQCCIQPNAPLSGVARGPVWVASPGGVAADGGSPSVGEQADGAGVKGWVLDDETLVVAWDRVCATTGRASMAYTQGYVELTAAFHHPDYMVGKA